MTLSSTTYKTKQRQLIWDYLCAHKQIHVVADDIVDYLRQQGTSVGKATVYRFLDKLVEQGTVRRFFVEEGMSACYQLIENAENCHAHFHLKCTQCGALLHIECDYLNEVHEHIYEKHGFEIDNTKTVFYGICESCTGKKLEKRGEK